MEFSNRGVQPQTTDSPASNIPVNKHGGKSKMPGGEKWKRIGVVVAGAAVVILVIAVIILLATGGKKSEETYVDSSKLQAVFLNTGQVYFGNIKTLNDDYLRLTNIYYLQTSNNGSSDNQNTNVSLVKLGCELHEPLDQMLINSDQVTFWENLGDNGQVAKAVAQFEKDNPEGQKCVDQSNSASNNSGSNAQNATTNNSANDSSNSSSNNSTNTNGNQ